MWKKLFGKKEAQPKPINFDFEKDTKYLFALISTLIENEKFKLKISGKQLLTDNDIIDLSKQVTQDTMQTLSEPYKELLGHYIADDQLVTFISLIIVKNAVQLGLSINRNVVGSKVA